MSQKLSIPEKLDSLIIAKYFLLSEEKNARLCQDILLWFIETERFQYYSPYDQFRFTDVGKWLIDHHRPFIEEYADSSAHVTKSYRLHVKRDYIQGRIDELIKFGMMERNGITKSKRGNSEVQLYSFTIYGKYIAWILKCKKSTGYERTQALDRIFGNIFGFFKAFKEANSSYLMLLSRMIRKIKERKIFENPGREELMVFLFPNEENFYLLVHKLIFSYDYFEILSESIREIESEEAKNLLLFQIKLEIEKSPFLLSTKEWERTRYENISDYSKAVLQFICSRCAHVFPSIINIYSFLVLMSTFRLEKENYYSKLLEYKISCPDCEKADKLVILPSWMESAELLLRKRIVETKNYSEEL